MDAPVHLPNLLLLDIIDMSRELHVFLRHFTVGSHTKTSIKSYEFDGLDGLDGTREMIEKAVTLFVPTHDRSRLSLSVGYDGFQHQIFVHKDRRLAGPPMLSLTQSCLRGDVQHATSTVLRVLGEHVCRLRLVDRDSKGRLPPLPSLPHVHTVEAMDHAGSQLIRLFRDCDASSEQIVLPSLSVLDIAGSCYKSNDLHALEDALRRRERITGRRLVRLYVREEDVGEVACDVADLTRSYPDNKKPRQKDPHEEFMRYMFMLDQNIGAPFYRTC
jgi:hypothetical protein